MKKVRRGAVENMCTGGRALKQMFTIFLCIVLLGQMQNAVAEGQEPAPESQQVKPTTLPPAPPSPAQRVDPVGQDQLPAAPAPQISMAIQQAQPTQSGQETTPQQPLGTAAAPYEKPVGVPGSRPAGAAIAPAKQRRVRAIAIKVGLLLAGAGAVGAVVGLSRASHSEP